LFETHKEPSSPYINRFLSADTIVPGYANPQNLNRYSYVTNNPLRYTDPTGHMLDDGCRSEGCNLTSLQKSIDAQKQKKHEEEAARRKCAKGNKNYCSNEKDVAEAGKFVASVLIEPADWAMTIGDCVSGNCSLLALGFMALPGVPGRLGKYADDALGILPYNQLRTQIKGTALEAHHIIEKRFANTLGTVPNNMLSVAMSPKAHQQFTNAWREAIGYSNSNSAITTLSATKEQIWTAAQNIYNDFPDMLDAARRTIFGE
jgi:hypothetical protein